MSSKMILVVFLAILTTLSSFGNKDDDRNVDHDQHKEQNMLSRKMLLKQFLTSSPQDNLQRQHEIRLKADLKDGMDSIIKNRLLIVQKNDPVLAKLLLEFYQKSLEYDSIAEDILKYVMTTEKEIKTSIILDSYMFKSIKHFKNKIISN